MFDIYDSKSPCLKIYHQFELETRIGTGEYFAFPFFELDTFNAIEKFNLNIPDELIVSCEWAKNIILDNGIDKNIHVVPMGVDTDIFDQKLNTVKTDEDPYVFIMIGKWEIRKGYDLLLDLFNSAFNEKDNVELWLLGSSDTNCFSQKEIDEWHSFYLSDNNKLKNKTKIFPRLPTQLDVAKTISMADCGLFISRAEGWNLELLEVMAMNKPVITTNYSAHTEFCHKDNAYLVNIDSTEKAFDGKWFNGQGNWAKIGSNQIEQTIEHMRYVYKNKIRSNKLGVLTSQKYSWQNTANALIECIL
jgi:glycosyltransferase involved in cell wall biosynthesis